MESDPTKVNIAGFDPRTSGALPTELPGDPTIENKSVISKHETKNVFAKYDELDRLPGFAQIPKRKIYQELKKKYVTRPGFEPATSCAAFGYSDYLAIDQKEKLIKNLKE